MRARATEVGVMVAAGAPEHDEDHDGGEDGEDDEAVADGFGGGGFGEHAEGGAGVEDVA